MKPQMFWEQYKWVFETGHAICVASKPLHTRLDMMQYDTIKSVEMMLLPLFLLILHAVASAGMIALFCWCIELVLIPYVCCRIRIIVSVAGWFVGLWCSDSLNGETASAVENVSLRSIKQIFWNPTWICNIVAYIPFCWHRKALCEMPDGFDTA